MKLKEILNFMNYFKKKNDNKENRDKILKTTNFKS